MSKPSVLVIRSPDRFSKVLVDQGFSVDNLELIRTEPVQGFTELDLKISSLSDYDGLFFTSPVAAEIFIRRFTSVGGDYSGKIYVLGQRAKKVLIPLGSDLIYRDDVYTAAELIAAAGRREFEGKRFLFFRGEKSLRVIPELLADIARVDEVVVYRTLDIDPGPEVVREFQNRLDKNEFDWICFFSPSSVDVFKILFDIDVTNDIGVAAIGTTTAKRIVDLGFRSPWISPQPDAGKFAEFLTEFIGKNE